jgi:type II secretory pathway pseudopilin PulG
MTGRDRIVLIVFASLAVLAAVWLLAVSPERKRATKLATQVSAAQAQLATAESEVASARGAQARYTAEYASVVSLGKAVPPSQEVSSLIYQLDQASNQKQVEFNSITSGSGGGAGASPASAAATATPGAALAGFTQMPFTFVFNGSFLDLYHLFQQLNHYTLRTASGGLEVSGRLLTIQSLKLAPGTGAAQGAGKAGGKSAEGLTGTITAAAYVLPASQGLTGGATPASPAGGASPAAAGSGAAGSPTTPAIVRANP